MATSNYFSQKISLSLGSIVIATLVALLIGGGIAYFSFKPDSSENLLSELMQLDRQQTALSEIPTPDARDMIAYYQQTTNPTSGASTAAHPLCNPKAIYFDLKPLAYYVIRKLPKRASGIRIYFGRYRNPHPVTVDGKTYDFMNHSTVIFMPTRKDKNGIPVDILDEKTTTLLQPYIQNEPYNGGISCPPLPPQYCSGQLLAP